jgi:FemAB-related protein (PEP-CTERM system-associated)
MESPDINIRLAESADISIWDDYVDFHRDSLAYHRFAWKQSIEESYGFDCPYFLAEQNGKVCGVLPTAHIHIPFSKGLLVSLPYCDVGGVLAESFEVERALLNFANRYAFKHNIPKIEIRYTPRLLSKYDQFNLSRDINKYNVFDTNTSQYKKVRMLLELHESSDILLSSFKSKLRSQILKPVRDGLVFSLGGVELLENFYSIFAENMRALGSPVHSKRWLYSIFKYYGLNAKCGIVFLPNKIAVAGGIVLCQKKIVSIPWASSLQCYNHFNSNMILYWSLMKFAMDNGYRFFDFGRSTPGEGTFKFKAQWGAKPQPIFWERRKVGKKIVISYSSWQNSRLSKLSKSIIASIINKIPLYLTIFLGSRIRKYIPL